MNSTISANKSKIKRPFNAVGEAMLSHNESIIADNGYLSLIITELICINYQNLSQFVFPFFFFFCKLSKYRYKLLLSKHFKILYWTHWLSVSEKSIYHFTSGIV